MMVSKVAVMAIVGILAIPILMGYAMNLDETTVKDYKSNEDPVNVTQLLQTGTDWSIAYGNPYQMNANQGATISNTSIPQYPVYNKISSVKTSLPMTSGSFGAYDGITEARFDQFAVIEMIADYVEDSSNYYTLVMYNSSNVVLYSLDGIQYFRWESDSGRLYYYGDNGITGGSLNVPNLAKIAWFKTGSPNQTMYYNIVWKTGNTSFADLADGFYFKRFSQLPWDGINSGWDLKLPDNTVSAVLSVNLDSITDANYTIYLDRSLRLNKTTTDGVVSWKVYSYGTGWTDLYYDPNINDNTYQIVITDNGSVLDSPNYYYNYADVQLRYIGGWHKTIGVANYYVTYDNLIIREGSSNNPVPVLDSIKLSFTDVAVTRTPTIRVDSAQFRAFEYSVIEDNVYDPAAFKTNPATTVSGIEQYGNSITFGGNTYTVKDGNITMGAHQIPINNMVFDSVPNEDTLSYDNRINGTVVSTTATPSTITFNGKWGAIITTVSMDEYAYTKTEWVAGSFGWDGLDHNFLIVGLLASLGAFIALGIYARRARASIWPLLIVCGGAALMFFLML